ncbi:MAG TPA: hypothetical protein VMZ28_01005 [Kofleriaceae bacterium]|nr:hypothetical protein [Kofleriaceae bacterium]
MRRTGLALLLVAAVVAAGAPPVVAQSAPEAHRLYEDGVAAYRAKDYPRAAALFRQAYDAGGQPDLLFNAAQAYRLAGECANAAAHYRRYLDEVPGASNRRDAEAKLAEVEACARTETEADRDTRSENSSPLEFSGRVDEHARSASAVNPPVAPYRSRTGLWIAAGGGVALAGSLVFWLRARSADGELDDLVENGGTFDGHYQDLERRRDREETIAVAGAAVGAVAVAAGLALYFLMPPREPDRASPRADVALVPGGAVLLFGFTP